MRRFRSLVPVVVAVSLVGCYHATVNTGRTPSGQIIEVPWAHSFIIGLVPPATVEAAAQCPNGVASVETQHSFLNGLVAALTFSLYTPMTITVRCAAGGSPDAADDAKVRGTAKDGGEAIMEAARLSAEIGQPVLVELK